MHFFLLVACTSIHILLCFSAETNYFEMEIVDKGAAPHLTLSVGVVSRQFSLENLPGRSNESYAFCPGDGFLFRGNEAGSPFGPRADVGDKVGCGIKFSPVQSQGKNAFPIGGATSGHLFFTHNSKEVGSIPVNIPPGGYFPALSMTDCHSVVTRCGLRYIQEEDIMMMVDNCDDDWLNLHDIRLNGPVLEYIGKYLHASSLVGEQIYDREVKFRFVVGSLEKENYHSYL